MFNLNINQIKDTYQINYLPQLSTFSQNHSANNKLTCYLQNDFEKKSKVEEDNLFDKYNINNIIV